MAVSPHPAWLLLNRKACSYCHLDAIDDAPAQRHQAIMNQAGWPEAGIGLEEQNIEQDDQPGKQAEGEGVTSQKMTAVALLAGSIGDWGDHLAG